MHRRSIVWRIFVRHAAVLALAFAVLVAARHVSHPIAIGEFALVAAGFVAVLAADFLLLRRTLAPLRRLAALMERFDPLNPGERVTPFGPSREHHALTATFNRMLDRLETERQEAAERVLGAHERERRRLARELHDALGQGLTVMMLEAERAAREVPEAHREQLVRIREAARAALEDLRRIMAELRPEALEHLGLSSALTGLASSLSARTGLHIHRRLQTGLPRLDADTQLTLYRIAQEALTNVVRHAGASRAEIVLARNGSEVVLRVTDDGTGIGDSPRRNASGLSGMRERVLLVGGNVEIESQPGAGTAVTARVPLRERP